MHPPDLQGHRGCRGLMPENTLDAMIRAVDLGVTTLEMDAVITADGEVVLSHEPFFHHEISTKPDGLPVTAEEERRLNVYRMTYAEVRSFDVGLKPHPRFPQQQKRAAAKPRLCDVIDGVRQHCAQTGKPFPQWNIETKSTPATDGVFHPAPEAFVETLVGVLREKEVEAAAVVQSFDVRTLQVLHRRYPAIRTALLVEEDDHRSPDEQVNRLGFVPTVYSPAHTLVTRHTLERCHQKGILVIPWTVNELADMKRLLALGADGLISDYPNLYAQLR